MKVIRIPSERMDSNSYLVEEDGHVVIIDGSSYEGILQAVHEQGWTVDQLLLTHEHFDHIWYLQELREAFGMPVVACRLCSERIQDVSTNLSNIADIMAYFKTGEIPEEKTATFHCDAAEIVYNNIQAGVAIIIYK